MGGLSRSMGCTPRDWNSNSYFSLPPSLSLSLLRCFQSAVSLVSLGTEEPLFLSVCLCPAIPSAKWMSVFANSACKCCFSLSLAPSVRTVRARKRFFLIWIRFAM